MRNKFLTDEDLYSAQITDPALMGHGGQGTGTVPTESLTDYLVSQENSHLEIAQLQRLLQMNRAILEIGCGRGSAAREIALKNPDFGLIATDQYDWSVPEAYGSGYRKTALLWKERKLEAQLEALDNLVLLRADASLIPLLPLYSIDTLLLVNPEPAVGRAIMASLKDPAFFQKFKPGENQIVVLPFSREMGVTSCGGYEFDHGEDWSRGLGFLMESGFDFRKSTPVQWSVNLAKVSSYSCTSTQQDVYVGGCVSASKERQPEAEGLSAWMRRFVRNDHRRPKLTTS